MCLHIVYQHVQLSLEWEMPAQIILMRSRPCLWLFPQVCVTITVSQIRFRGTSKSRNKEHLMKAQHTTDSFWSFFCVGHWVVRRDFNTFLYYLTSYICWNVIDCKTGANETCLLHLHAKSKCAAWGVKEMSTLHNTLFTLPALLKERT